MKKIVPFNNVLSFSTDVSEITAISLEHDIKPSKDAISGTFYITGEYKITEGELKKEPFSFELPFDIALGCNYDLDTLSVDIDDFRYELLDDNKMKINIDLSLDGKCLEEETIFTPEEVKELEEDIPEPMRVNITESLDLEDDNSNDNNINIFNGFNEEEKYVTYHVYPFTENDSLDKVMEKYHVSKEELAKYNQIENLHPGDKLIIPDSSDE